MDPLYNNCSKVMGQVFFTFCCYRKWDAGIKSELTFNWPNLPKNSHACLHLALKGRVLSSARLCCCPGNKETGFVLSGIRTVWIEEPCEHWYSVFTKKRRKKDHDWKSDIWTHFLPPPSQKHCPGFVRKEGCFAQHSSH